MKVFIELPTWLGDSVMCSATIENLCLNFPSAKITLFGNKTCLNLFKNQPNCVNFIKDSSKKSGSRLLNLMRISRSLEHFDVAISFRSHFASKFLLFCLKARQKFCFKYYKNSTHQVEKYLNFLNLNLGLKELTKEPKLHFLPIKFSRPTLGLNPGANYGSAKRWKAEYFATLASRLAEKYDIIIFGVKSEEQLCAEISDILSQNNVRFTNLCSKTSIDELAQNIAGLSLFITNDSGPMHIASAFKVPLTALFGPTNFIETAPFYKENALILHLDLPCQPCMKRSCPLGHHKCMDELKPDFVLEKMREFFKILS